jgi:hypothetical protein
MMSAGAKRADFGNIVNRRWRVTLFVELSAHPRFDTLNRDSTVWYTTTA